MLTWNQANFTALIITRDGIERKQKLADFHQPVLLLIVTSRPDPKPCEGAARFYLSDSPTFEPQVCWRSIEPIFLPGQTPVPVPPGQKPIW